MKMLETVSCDAEGDEEAEGHRQTVELSLSSQNRAVPTFPAPAGRRGASSPCGSLRWAQPGRAEVLKVPCSQ